MDKKNILELTESLDYNVQMVIRRYANNEDNLTSLYDTYGLSDTEQKTVIKFIADNDIKPESGGLMLMPPPDDKCFFCAVEHEPEQPHDATSFYYQFYFNGKFKRAVTWSDAIAHCSEELKVAWKEALIEKGVWTEHPEPIPLILKGK